MSTWSRVDELKFLGRQERMADDRIWSEQEEPEPLGRTKLLSKASDAGIRHPSPTQVPPHRSQWEYKMINPAESFDIFRAVGMTDQEYVKTAHEYLDELGADGWELVSVVSPICWIFKQPKRVDT